MQKLTRSGLNGFRRGTFERQFAFFEAYKDPIPKRRKLLAKTPISQANLNWTWSVFPLLKLFPVSIACGLEGVVRVIEQNWGWRKLAGNWLEQAAGLPREGCRGFEILR